MAESKTAYVLPEDEAHVMEYQQFPGFPGLFFPGVPVPLEELGFSSASEAADRIAELGLPLKRVTGKAAEPSRNDPPPTPPDGKLPSATPEDMASGGTESAEDEG